MASLDLVKFVMYTLLIGFIYGFTTYMYDQFAGVYNTMIAGGLVAPISVQVAEICYYSIIPFALTALLFTCLSALLVANARSEKLSPYFGLNPWGIITCGIGINAAMILNFCMSFLDPVVYNLASAMPVTQGSGWDMTIWLNRGFTMMHVLCVAIIVLGYAYMVFNSLSVESQEGVV